MGHLGRQLEHVLMVRPTPYIPWTSASGNILDNITVPAAPYH